MYNCPNKDFLNDDEEVDANDMDDASLKDDSQLEEAINSRVLVKTSN